MYCPPTNERPGGSPVIYRISGDSTVFEYTGVRRSDRQYIGIQEDTGVVLYYWVWFLDRDVLLSRNETFPYPWSARGDPTELVYTAAPPNIPNDRFGFLAPARDS